MDEENKGLGDERIESKVYVVENIKLLEKAVLIDAYPMHLKEKKRIPMDYRSVALSYEQIKSIIDQIRRHYENN